MLLLSQIKSIEAEVDNYFQLITEAALHFQEGLAEYMSSRSELFSARLQKVSELEGKADDLRRSIRYKLYTDMLIPDARGDVLGLLETSDNIIDQMKEVMIDLDIERPDFPVEWSDDFGKLAHSTQKAVESFKMAVNSFFQGRPSTNDHINKVYFYEEEVDQVERRLKQEIYQGKLIKDLARKNQLKIFVERIADVTDITEDVCERLSVYSIKRSV